MEDREKGKSIKVKFSDKRRRGDGDAATDTEASSGSQPQDVASAPSTQTVFEGGLREATPSPAPKAAEEPSSPKPHLAGTSESSNQPEAVDDQNGAEAAPDYLEDLRRVQADFDNYRKRMLREQTQLAQRASARLVERLLPILDNFESAISHGEGGAGVELVYKELRRVLEEEGLEEIAAEGRPFDPRLHEAFEAVEDESVTEPTVRSVLRRGYELKGQVLRAPMVSVARPPENEPEATVANEDDAEQDAAEG